MTEFLLLTVSGMKCGGCESNVTAQLTAIEGIKSVKASSQDKEVRIEYDADETNLSAIKEAITKAGYKVE
ncbi:MAG: heavy-metal-associated domain-containing protein [Methylobacter sp.]|nr:heavy-metal-associated domain-containing protein [Methylobacter sp.]